ncbi:MAG: DUF4332 domain-containing protein [Bacteroidia bacterium]|nr:DUF4332 domain-containing protein [Bacteroidia bacterium]
MAYSLSTLNGVNKTNTSKLKKAGVGSVESLLKAGGTKKGRKDLATSTKINEKTLLKWVNMADLCRIKGVSKKYSELLEAAGVDTVKELKTRKPENLVEKMEKVNKRKKLVKQTPGVKNVKGWVTHAKKLKPMVKY